MKYSQKLSFSYVIGCQTMKEDSMNVQIATVCLLICIDWMG